METELKDIMWGSNFFVNAQFALGLVSRIDAYVENKLPLENLFAYGSAIQKQTKTPVYLPIEKCTKELRELEQAMKHKTLTIHDKKIILFVLNNVYYSFTKQTIVGI